MRYELRLWDRENDAEVIARIDATTDREAVEKACASKFDADQLWLNAVPDRALDGDASVTWNITLLRKLKSTCEAMKQISRFTDINTQVYMWTDELREAVEHTATDYYVVPLDCQRVGTTSYTLYTTEDGQFRVCLDHDLDASVHTFTDEQRAYKFFDSYVEAMKVKEEEKR